MSEPLILVYDFSENFVFTPPVLDTVGITNIDWGDGSLDTVIPHTYLYDGIFTVKIYGSVLSMSNIDSSENINTSAENLIRCTSFGAIGITSLTNAFSNCINLIEVPQILPSSVTNLNYCFPTQYDNLDNYTYIDLYVANWNVSNVTSMENMFDGLVLSTSTYNLLLNNWSNLAVVPNVTFSTSNLIYTDEAARTILTSSPNNWTILGDVLLPNTIYKNTEFTITYNNTFILGDTYYLYFGDTLIDTVVYSTNDFIIFTAVPPVTGNIVFTIEYDNTVVFTGSFNVLKQIICTPIIKPTYSFSEQVSCSDRIKQLKDQLKCRK
jgi:hypothetical protein